MRSTVVSVLAAMLAVLTLGATHGTPQRVAVLRFAALPVGMNDEVLPTSREVGALTQDLRSAIRSRGDLVVVDVPANCIDDSCAIDAGKRVHADAVVFGQLTRYMALMWAMQLHHVDMRTGRDSSKVQVYKGDFSALEYDMSQISRSIRF